MGSIYHAGQEVTNISISGEGYNIVIETTDSELYGETVTIKQNGTVIGTTTFDNEGHAEYKVSQAGTYIVSVTYEGTESTKEVTVSDASVDINVRLSLSSWLVAGGVDPSDYPTFEDLDEETIRRLMLVHNAVDYIASAKEGDTLMETIIRNMECAKWINLCDYAQDEFEKNEAIKAIMDEVGLYGYGEIAPVGQVPVLSADDSRIIKSSEYSSSYVAWHAFTNSAVQTAANSWASVAGLNAYIGFDLGSAKYIGMFRFQCMYSVGYKYRLQGSNDNFVNDINDITEDAVAVNETVYNVKALSHTAYRYYRIYMTSIDGGSGHTFNTNYVQFYAYEPIGNVPVMTANNAPYGTAIRSSELSDYYKAFLAFNNSDIKRVWIPTKGATNNYIGYTFVNPVKVKSLHFVARIFGMSAFAFTVQGSNDGFVNDIHDITTFTTQSATTEIRYETDIDVDSSDYYLSYRIFSASVMYVNDNSALFVATLQFYGRELTPLVPTMTANDKPKGEAFGYPPNANTSLAAYKAFDGDTTTRWSTPGNATSGYLGYDFEIPVLVKAVRFVEQDTHNYTLTVKESDDKSTWNGVGNPISVTGVANREYNYPVNSSVAHRFWGLFFDSLTAGESLYTAQFYGFDYSEKEFAQGSTRKTIYDHGVELEDVTVYTEGTGSKATKEADCINLSIPASTHVSACAYANIDLADHNVLGVKFGRTYAGGSYLSVYSQIPNYAQTGRQATKYSGIPISEPTQTLDISNLNDSYYVTSQCANNNSGGVASVDMAELWLE